MPIQGGIVAAPVFVFVIVFVTYAAIFSAGCPLFLTSS